MAEDNGVGKGLLVGFLTGAVVGSVIALLYAPKSGEELRKDIKEKTDEFIGDAEEYLDKAKTRANELINDGKRKSESLVADAKVKVDGLLNEAEKILTEAKSKTNEYVETGKSLLDSETGKIKNAIKAGVDTYKSEKES